MSTGRQLLLGLDVGTTATKALLFDLQGGVIAAASRAYGLVTPHPGWVEQDPENLWDAVVGAVCEVTKHLQTSDRVLALCQASQGGTTIPVDRDREPTYNAISWMDERGKQEFERAGATVGADYVRTTTGWPLSGTLPLQHIAWLRANRPDVFARTRHFLFVNDFIARRLAGVLAMNPSDASITQLFDIAHAEWDDRLLETAGITSGHLSPILPSGEVIGRLNVSAAEVLGLSEDTLVVSGAHDQYCAAVGTGVTHPGEMLLSCGTAWVLLAVPETLQAGLESGMAISCHAIPGRWGAIRSLGGMGASLEWLLQQVWRHDPEAGRDGLYAALNRQAAAASPGAGGLLFLPLSGGHGPGGFVNLALSHTRGDMARAVMEGIALELRWAIDEIRASGVTVTHLKMVGGAAESGLWPHIVANITGIPVTLPAERQAAARGAAILAGVGAGCFADAEAGYTTFRGGEVELAPDPDAEIVYHRQFTRYRRLLGAIAGALSLE